MANSKIPSVQITDTFNTQRGRFNQLVDSVGDVSTLTTTATDITNAIKEHDAELGTISAGAMGTTASTVSTAIAELDGRLDSINTVELLSPRMSLSDGTAVNTIAGKLEVSDSADFADNLSVQGNLAVGGNTTMSGTLTVDGEVTFKAGTNSNINLGDANTDNVVFNADVNSNIIPNTDDAYDLGSSTQEWRHVYVDGTVNTDNLLADSATVANNMSVGGTLDVTGDTTLSNTITVQDSAYITGNLDLGSNLDVAGNVNVTGTVVSEGALTVEDSAYITSNLDVGGNVTVAGDTTFANTITVQDSAYITGNLDLGSELTVAGDATFANTITVQDSAYITGNLDIGGDVTSTGTAFTISAETGTDDNVSLGDTITFEGGEGINTTVSDNNIKIDGELATSSNKGVASFSTDNFLVTSGVVTIKDNGVALGTETTGNYMSGITGTTDEITVTHTPGEGSSATISLPDDVTIGQDLDVTRNLTVTGTFTVGGATTFTGGTRYAASFNVMNDQVNVNNNNRAGIAIDRPTLDSAVLQWNELGDYWEAGLTTSVNRLALQNDSAYFTTLNVGDITNDRILIAGANGSVEDDTNLTFNGTTFEVGTAFDVTASSGNTTIGGTLDVTGAVNLNKTTQSSGTTSGALIVDGGVGIAKNAHIGGTLDATGAVNLNKTTDATSSTAGGSLTVDGGAAIAKKLYVGGELTVTGNTTFNNDVLFDGATSGYNIEWDKSDHSLTFLTGTSLKMGDGDDMSLSVNGSSDTILGTGTNTFYLRSADMRLQSNGQEDYVRGQANGAVTLYHNALNKLATTKYGVDVVGLMEADSAVISGDISIGGNLTVSGTTTTINTETLTLQDNIIVLNSNSAATPTEDAGLEVERGNSTNVVLKWDEGDNRWQFTNDGSTYYNIPISTEYNNTTYSLPLATNTVRGGIELFSNTDQAEGAQTVTATAGRTYGIQLNAANQAVVNVPWVDTNTNTTYSAGKDLDLNGTTFDIEATLNHVTAITTANNTPFTLTSSGTGLIFMKAEGGGVSYYKDDAYAAGDTYISSLLFQAGNASNARTTYAGIEARRLSSTEGHLALKSTYGNLSRTVFENDGSTGNTSVKAISDIYLEPTGDNVYMRGTTSGEQLNFTLDDFNQTIAASDKMILTNTYWEMRSSDANNDPQFATASGQIYFRKGTTTNAEFWIDVQPGTTTDHLATVGCGDNLKLQAPQDIAIMTGGGETVMNDEENIVLHADNDIFMNANGGHINFSHVNGYGSGEGGSKSKLDMYLSNTEVRLTSKTNQNFSVIADDGDVNIRADDGTITFEKGGGAADPKIVANFNTNNRQQLIATDNLMLSGTGINDGSGRTIIQSSSQFPGLRVGSASDLTLTGSSHENLEMSDRYISFGVYDTNAGTGVFTPARTNTASVTNGSFAMNFKHGTSTVMEWYADKDPFSSTADYQNICFWTVDGDFTAAGQIAAYSDARLKDNIETVDNALDKVSSMRGVTFTRNDKVDKEKKYVGVIAQEMQEVVPEVVNHNEEKDVYTVDYDGLVGVLIEAIKDLKNEVEELKGKCKCH